MNFYIIASGLLMAFLFGCALGYSFGFSRRMRFQHEFRVLSNMVASSNRRLAALLSISAKDDPGLLHIGGFLVGPGFGTPREQLLGKTSKTKS